MTEPICGQLGHISTTAVAQIMVTVAALALTFALLGSGSAFAQSFVCQGAEIRFLRYVFESVRLEEEGRALLPNALAIHLHFPEGVKVSVSFHQGCGAKPNYYLDAIALYIVSASQAALSGRWESVPSTSRTCLRSALPCDASCLRFVASCFYLRELK